MYSNLQAMKDVNLTDVSTDELVDIKDVFVNRELSKNERITAFVQQIKNPYCFKCGKFVVKVRYSDNGRSMEDCLKNILL